MVKKRGFVTQFIRHLIQLAAFVLFPGMFISVFSAVRDLATAVMDGRFSFGGLFPQILLVFTVILVTVLWGRFFCGFLCAFGMLQELLFFFPGRFLFQKVQVPQRLDAVMKYFKYGVFAFLAVGVWILALPVDSSWDPWGVFGMLVSGNFSAASRAIPTVGFVLLLAIAAGSLFVERFFCRYLCPLGAVFAAVSGKRLYKIRRRGDTCTNCGLCSGACSMGICIPQKDAVESGECIQCMRCLAICPKESLSANPAGAIAGTAAAAAIGGTVIAGRLISFPEAETKVDRQAVEQTEKAEKGNYKDGVYTGMGEGFRGTTQVQVTVEDGYIADITVLSFQDDRDFFQKAQSAVINEILAEQTYDVSAVSGATFSSSSIMDAVADALANGATQYAGNGEGEAGEQPEDGSAQTDEYREQSGSGESRPSGGDESEPADNGQESDPAAGRFSVADGTYQGTGKGFRGTTSVSVTVEDGMITDITVSSYEDDAAYFTRAQDVVISEIIRTQSLEVQAVSGATFSSNSIMNAVADALGAEPVGLEQSEDGESGSKTGRSGTGGGNGYGSGQPGTGGGNGYGSGQPGNGRHGGGWHGHRGNRN